MASATMSLTGTIRDASGTNKANVTVKARLAGSAHFDSDNAGISTKEVSTATAADGTFTLTLLQSTAYEVYCQELGLEWVEIETGTATLTLEAALRG